MLSGRARDICSPAYVDNQICGSVALKHVGLKAHCCVLAYKTRLLYKTPSIYRVWFSLTTLKSACKVEYKTAA